MSFSKTNIGRARAQLERIFAQGLIEKASVAGGPESACTARVAFDQEHGWLGPDDGGFAMRRGLFAGSLAEHELQSYATEKGFSVALGAVADGLMKSMSFGQLGVGRQHELRNTAVQWVRRWQEQFPQDDGGDLDLGERMTNLLSPQTDMFVRRPDRFAIRVRPDNVVGVGNKLVAWEWSTAKSVQAISPARFGLNHHALLRERLRRHATPPT